MDDCTALLLVARTIDAFDVFQALILEVVFKVFRRVREFGKDDDFTPFELLVVFQQFR